MEAGVRRAFVVRRAASVARTAQTAVECKSRAHDPGASRRPWPRRQRSPAAGTTLLSYEAL
jgi:hypothetical protein